MLCKRAPGPPAKTFHREYVTFTSSSGRYNRCFLRPLTSPCSLKIITKSCERSDTRWITSRSRRIILLPTDRASLKSEYNLAKNIQKASGSLRRSKWSRKLCDCRTMNLVLYLFLPFFSFALRRKRERPSKSNAKTRESSFSCHRCVVKSIKENVDEKKEQVSLDSPLSSIPMDRT